MNKILFIGELPPKTIHGVSLSNGMNLSVLSQENEISTIKEKQDYKTFGKFHLSKIFNIVNITIKIRKKSRDIHFDFLYSNMAISNFGMLKNILYLLAFKKRKNSKKIFHIHRGDFEHFYKKSKLSKLLTDFFVKRVDKLIFLSDKLVPNYLKDSDKVLILPNTIPSESKYSVIQNSRERLLYLSNYIKEKGILDLLSAFEKLDRNNIILNCYGNFTDENLKEKILSKQRDTIIINNSITGEDKFDVINKSDVLILPSYNEGQPLTILEAMMCGTIVIASDVGDVKNMLGEDYPFLFKKKEEKELEEVILKFLNTNEEELDKLALYLRDRYHQRYSQEQHRKNLLEIFK